MLCSRCGKRPASVHVEQVVDGRKTEEYLCEQCAESIWGFGTLNLNKVFSSHFGAAGGPGLGQTCPGCGMSLAEFNSSGRLGCSRCYQSFGPQLLPVINKFHGVRRHVGKVKLAGPGGPELANKNYEKLALEKQLSELVQLEKFEEAAQVRDKIRALEQQINRAAMPKAGESQ